MSAAMRLGQERGSESGRYQLPIRTPRILIVIPPRGGTGLRHAVRIDSGDMRAIGCGLNVDGWYLELKPFDPTTIGCKRCRRAVGRPGPGA